MIRVRFDMTDTINTNDTNETIDYELYETGERDEPVHRHFLILRPPDRMLLICPTVYMHD
jgi:hypothetical protein